MTSPRTPSTGTATPVSPSSSSSRVSAHPRSRMRTPSRRRSARSARVAGVSRSRSPGGRSRASQARKTLPRAEVWAGHVDLGPVAGAEEVGGVDLRDLHDAVAAGDAEVHGLAGGLADLLHHGPGEPDELLPRVVARGVEPEEPARDVGPGGVALEQPGALERGEHPRGRRLRQAARVLEVGERHRLVGVDDRGDQVRGAVQRTRAGGGRRSRRSPRRFVREGVPSGSMMWNLGSTS